jgi:hypothetical protein
MPFCFKKNGRCDQGASHWTHSCNTFGPDTGWSKTFVKRLRAKCGTECDVYVQPSRLCNYNDVHHPNRQLHWHQRRTTPCKVQAEQHSNEIRSMLMPVQQKSCTLRVSTRLFLTPIKKTTKQFLIISVRMMCCCSLLIMLVQ